MTWSEKKFSAFNLAFLRRETVKSMELRKLAMLSGLYANTNLDEEKGARAKIINDLEEQFAETIAEMYDPTEKQDPLDNPFFTAMQTSGDMTANEVQSYEKAKRNQPWIPTNLDEDISP